jgi:atypical dual specificity phosphatase
MSAGIILSRKSKLRPPVLQISNEVSQKQTISSTKLYKVCGQLYISGYESAKNYELLVSNSITHILNLAGESKCPNVYSGSFNYCSLKMPDSPQVDILFFLYFAIDFIIESIRNNGVVLVHCIKGTSRAATVALAYLMLKGLDEAEAYSCLMSSHPNIDPNFGFVCQLKKFLQIKEETRAFKYSAKYHMFVNIDTPDPNTIVIDKNACTLYLDLSTSQHQLQLALQIAHLWERFNSIQATIVYL